MRTYNKAAGTLGLALFLASCSYTSGDTGTGLYASDQKIAAAELTDRQNDPVGRVILVRSEDALSLKLELGGLEPGVKAFHLHTTADCSAPDFTSAGGHLNPDGNTHGSLSEGGKHLGDLPNITVGEDGTVDETFALSGTAADVLAAIFDADGTAVMIHQGPDDYVSDPAGAAGPRIACGELVLNSD
ncbi:superoxide dismutase family protein [Erythrobacter ani]|uniref:Superoxide dismutase family protein n=1 Tax=Erythrobacter ani TaxID=2827235 RepID=A0ABS6SL81_9SPHN|nr:superoxide dismutase family protein [Erythrobacter ani]MBV7265788.1 superoxide dismutase family protein [Erythrobacter ani]